MGEAEAVSLLLLPLAGLVVLEPVEHVLAFDLAELAELCRDLLDLLRVRGSHPSPVQRLQYPYLLLRRVPPRPSRVSLDLYIHICMQQNILKHARDINPSPHGFIVT